MGPLSSDWILGWILDELSRQAGMGCLWGRGIRGWVKGDAARVVICRLKSLKIPPAGRYCTAAYFFSQPTICNILKQRYCKEEIPKCVDIPNLGLKYSAQLTTQIRLKENNQIILVCFKNPGDKIKAHDHN